jgi:polyhydroxyalkanoate synthase
MLDFTEPGQIGLFVDEASVAAREATIGAGGILPGYELAFVFSSAKFEPSTTSKTSSATALR